MRRINSCHPYAAMTIILWSLAYVLTRMALQHFSPESLAVLRYMTASGTLIIFVPAAGIKPPGKEDLLLFLASGITGFFLYAVLFHKGQAMVTASTASVVIALVPVLTAICSAVIYKEKLRAWQWPAVGIQFAGVMVLMHNNGSFSLNGGLVWLLLAAVSLSIYNLLQRKLTRKYTAVQTAAYSIFSGTLLLLIFLPQAAGEVGTAPGIQLVYLLVLGVFSSAAAYVSWAAAFARAKQTSQVSNYMFLTPFVTSLLGFFMVHELPDRNAAVGSMIILTGVFLFNFGGRIRAGACRRSRKELAQAPEKGDNPGT